MKTLAIILLLSPGIQFAFAQQHFGWLTGTWKMKDKNVYEVWTSHSDTENLSGRSFIVKGADTIVTEVIRLEFHGGAYHYIPDVAGDQLPVDFVFTSSTRQSFVAENPDHDFPKLIRYRYFKKRGQEFLEAGIEGDGKTLSYSFQKVK